MCLLCGNPFHVSAEGSSSGEIAASAGTLPTVTETADAAGNTGTAYGIAVAQSAQGQISSLSENDWYAVNLVAGQTYTFALTGTGTNNLQDPYLRLYAGNGTTLLAQNDDGLPGLNSIFTYTATTTGTHYVDAAAWDNAGTGQYGLSITAGSRASFDSLMGAGVIDTDLSWSATPGTGATVSYGFRLTTNGNAPNFSQLSATQIAAIHTTLQQFSEVANLTFVEVNPGGYTNNATILFSDYRANDGAGAYAYYPGSTAASANAGDVWFNLNSVSTTSLPFGSYSFFVGLHEIGHAVGLSHPGLYNAGSGGSITYANNAQFAEDTHQYTVMSYFDEANTGAALGGYPETLMLHDVYALQQIYGANTSTRTGDTVYGFGSNAGAPFDFSVNTTPALCIWDAGGSDTLNCSGFAQNQTIDLNDGHFSNIGGLTGNVSIALGAVIDNAVGGGGNDSILGNTANNTLSGAGGNDIITGAGGNDAMDGGAGTDTAIYGGIRAHYQITLNQSGWFHILDLRSGTPEGADDVSNVEWFQFADGTVAAANLLGAVAGNLAPVQQSGNFNGATDANSDVLWRHDTGQVYIWEMNGLQTKAEGAVVHAAVPNDWHIQGIADFDADLNSDLVWRHDSGAVYFWEMNGLQTKAEGTVMHAAVTTDWQIQGVGDFDGDSRGDILWRHDSGAVYLWEMNGLQVKAEGTIQHAAVPTDWHIQGVGDFDGDGKSDLLWRHDSGQVYGWEMNGLQVTTEGAIPHAAVPNAWHVNGIGDFDGDGNDDILWRHDSGQVYIWEMNGLQVKAEGAVAHAAVPNDWQVQAIGDYDGDGNSDILWRHDSGQLYIWNMNGLQVKNEGSVAHAQVPNDWHIVA